MKVTATTVSICLILFLLCAGCSKDEPPPSPVRSAKVVKPIRSPAPEPIEVSLPSDVAREAEEGEIAALEEAGKALGPLTAADEQKVADLVRHHEPKPAAPQPRMALPGEEAKVPPAKPTTQLQAKVTQPPKPVVRPEETAPEEMAGYYMVKEANILSAIAAQEDVLGDPMKWPVLYRLNREILGTFKLKQAFVNTKIPGGVRLKIVSPDEAKENLADRIDKRWVVNVLSTTTDTKIVPAAMTLIDNGCTVYITRAKVKGKDWMRLRVGFFRDSATANTEGEKIMAMLNLEKPWVTKIGMKEFEEYAAY